MTEGDGINRKKTKKITLTAEFSMDVTLVCVKYLS
jgi:hypothetical protein